MAAFLSMENLPISHRSKTGHNLHGGAPGFELKMVLCHFEWRK